MKHETVVCDRCHRDLEDVPLVKRDDGAVLEKMSMWLTGRSLDLCPECFAAFLAWVDLGVEE